MKVQRALITAAGAGQRQLPLQSLVDRDGERKPLLRILADEVLAAGVETLGVVVHPGDALRYAEALDGLSGEVVYIEQPVPEGYGQAIAAARSFTGDDPFLHLVGDHLYVSQGGESCARQLVAAAEEENCAVSAVQATREHLLPRFGAVGGRLLPGSRALYLVEQVLEKPSPTLAEQTLHVPGLRAGHYLCFFGMHVLTAAVMDILDELIGRSPGVRIPLSSALNELAGREKYLAQIRTDARYDLGERYGLLNAQLALALSGCDREEVLGQLVELLASRESLRVKPQGSATH